MKIADVTRNVIPVGLSGVVAAAAYQFTGSSPIALTIGAVGLACIKKLQSVKAHYNAVYSRLSKNEVKQRASSLSANMGLEDADPKLSKKIDQMREVDPTRLNFDIACDEVIKKEIQRDTFRGGYSISCNKVKVKKGDEKKLEDLLSLLNGYSPEERYTILQLCQRAIFAPVYRHLTEPLKELSQAASGFRIMNLKDTSESKKIAINGPVISTSIKLAAETASHYKVHKFVVDISIDVRTNKVNLQVRLDDSCC